MAPRLTNNYSNETKSQIKQADLVLFVCDFDGAIVPLPSNARRSAHGRDRS